jgi:predicted RecA/RadA family phage recombinase
MSRASVLARGRAAAEAGMLDACVIRRETGSTTDRETGVPTPTFEQIYPALATGDSSAVCRVQEIFGFARDTSPSPDQSQLARYRILQLPVESSEGVRVGDQVVITACVNDPDLVGVVMVVRDQSGKSEATARRIGIEEITG